jgi:molecular chaperone GrpE
MLWKMSDEAKMVDEIKQTVDMENILECEKRRSEDYLNRLKYLQADFENLKKRFEKENEQIKNYCTERLVTQLLDVTDELELAIKTAKITSNTPQNLLAGIEMTLKKLKKVLEHEGVFQIESTEGKPFDPSRHDAIAAEERDDIKCPTVIEEIRKGYMYKEKVLRPSTVKVAIKSSKSQKEEKTKNE